MKNELFGLLFGFLLVFIGDFIIGRFKSAKSASPFVRFILATAFAYTSQVIKELILFFTDFYTDSNLQGYKLTPSTSLSFFKLFGTSHINTAQYPVFFLNLSFLDMLIGCAVGGMLLWGIREFSARKKVSVK